MRVALSDELVVRIDQAVARLGEREPSTLMGSPIAISAGTGPKYYFSRDGRVLIDASATGGQPLHEASDNQAVTAVVLAAKRFALPELLQLLPPPPPDAVACEVCRGRRFLPTPKSRPDTATLPLVCWRCSGRGFAPPRAQVYTPSVRRIIIGIVIGLASCFGPAMLLSGFSGEPVGNVVLWLGVSGVGGAMGGVILIGRQGWYAGVVGGAVAGMGGLLFMAWWASWRSSLYDFEIALVVTVGAVPGLLLGGKLYPRSST
jgi:hypothetical protein